MKLLLHSALIMLSFLIIFLWQKAGLTDFSITLLGFFIFLYLISSFKKKSEALHNGSLNIFFLNTAVLLLIQSTGGFNSQLFFLLYFLSFGIAFVLKPETVFVYTIILTIVFLPDSLKGDYFTNLIKLLSPLLLSPLAYFFGKEFNLIEKQDKKISNMQDQSKRSADKIKEDVTEIIKSHGQSLDQKDIETLKDIVEQTQDLQKKARS